MPSIRADFHPKPESPPKTVAELGRFIPDENSAIAQTGLIIDFIAAWMTDRGYDLGLCCLDLLCEKRKGEMRKDKKTPAILHELTQVIYAISLDETGYDLPDLELLISLILIHDLGEDFNMTQDDLNSDIHRIAIREKRSIPHPDRLAMLGQLLDNMTKERFKQKLYAEPALYFEKQLENPLTVIAKFLDRIHNMATRIGIHGDKDIATIQRKDREYVEESWELRTILGRAKEMYPAYAPVFTIMNKILTAQIYTNKKYLHYMYSLEIMPINIDEKTADKKPQKKLASVEPIPAGLDPLKLIIVRMMEAIRKRASYLSPPLSKLGVAAPA